METFISLIANYVNYVILYGNIDQTLVNSVHSLLNFENRWIWLSCNYNTVYS